MNKKTALEFSFFPALEIKKSVTDNDVWVIRGYAATSDLDRQNDVISKDALVHAVEDLKQNTTLFYEHKHDQPPVGKILDAGVDEKGLWIEAFISKTRPDIWQLIQEGILNKFSVGGKLIKGSRKFDSSTKQEFNLVEDIEILEVSIVGLPANPNAEFQVSDKCLSLIGGICKALESIPLEDSEERRDYEVETEKTIEEISKATDVENVTPTTVPKEEPTPTPAIDAVVEEVATEVAAAVEEAVAEVTTDTAVVEAATTAAQEAAQETAAETVPEAIAEAATETTKTDDTMALQEAIASLAAKVDQILAALEKKSEPVPVSSEKSLELGEIEEVVVKALDSRLGKIRLVPSRKGTIIKTDLDLKEESDDEVSTLLDEEKFKKLDVSKQKELIKKALTSIIRS